MGRPRKARALQGGTRAVIYLRISTEEQKKGHGIDSQLAQCSAYCQRRGYTIVATLADEGISGKGISERPSLATALAHCETGTADVIVAYAQDRFARSSGLFDEIRNRAKRQSYRLETADGRELTADEDELSGDAMAFVASIEAKLIAKRLYGGRKERSKIDGRGSGPLPYGYAYAPDGSVVIDDQAAAIVRQLFTLRATRGYQATADELNNAGWLKVTWRGATRWTISGIQRVERHEQLYRTGKRVWAGIEAGADWPRLIE